MASQTQKSRNGMEWSGGGKEGRKEPLLQGCWLAAWAGKISREEWMAWGGAGGASRVTLPLRKRVRDSRNELWDCFFFTVPTTHHNCMH